MPKIVSLTGRDQVLPPVQPSAGLRDRYQDRLERMIREMAHSVSYWTLVAYGENEPEMAMDASPARAMRDTMSGLARRWQKKFDDASDEVSEMFANKAVTGTDARMSAILKDAGWAIDFTMTRPMNDAYQAVIGENVGLIKSIPSEYLTQVQGMVMRSVAAGGARSQLATQLQDQYGITRRRAELIARDQNNKATAVFVRVRQAQLELWEAKWKHSNAGKTPRPDHVAADGGVYDIRKGMLISGEWIYPGELINCRCRSRTIIPGIK